MLPLPLPPAAAARWGLQAIYIDWLTPAAAEAAPATAAFLGSMGWCGLQPALLAALQGSGSSAAQQQHTQLHGGGNSTTGGWCVCNTPATQCCMSSQAFTLCLPCRRRPGPA